MKPKLLFFALLLCQLAGAQIPHRQYTIEQFFKTIGFGGGHFNKSEDRLLIHDNSSGIYNLYELDIATGKKKPLTRSGKESYFSIGYVPGKNDFLYSADKGGNENS